MMSKDERLDVNIARVLSLHIFGTYNLLAQYKLRMITTMSLQSELTTILPAEV